MSKKISNLNILDYKSRQAICHVPWPGSQDSNLHSEILTLAGDIRSRSWPNISGIYGSFKVSYLVGSFLIDLVKFNWRIGIHLQKWFYLIVSSSALRSIRNGIYRHGRLFTTLTQNLELQSFLTEVFYSCTQLKMSIKKPKLFGIQI